MVQKIIGLYSNNQAYTHFNKSNLFVEISNSHLAVCVRTESNNNIIAVEVFSINEQISFDWDDIFYEIRKQSVLLDKTYIIANIFYNNNESVLVPAYKFNAGTATGFLDIMFGSNDNCVEKYDSIDFWGEQMYNVYRINPALSTLIKTNFITITEFHTYSGLLKNLSIQKDNQQGDGLYVNFYNQSFIAFVIKNKKNQLIQTFKYTIPEDVLYYLLNLVENFKLVLTSDPLTISGMIEQNGTIIQLLQKHFANVYIASVDNSEIAFEQDTRYPLHYFTPFFNLQV